MNRLRVLWLLLKFLWLLLKLWFSSLGMSNSAVLTFVVDKEVKNRIDAITRLSEKRDVMHMTVNAWSMYEAIHREISRGGVVIVRYEDGSEKEVVI